jgi:hypothetical protein
MTIGDGDRKLWRDGEPYRQRFTATISEYRNTILRR